MSRTPLGLYLLCHLYIEQLITYCTFIISITPQSVLEPTFIRYEIKTWAYILTIDKDHINI